MAGHWLFGAHTEGKQALTVIDPVVSGMVYVQQGALLPQAEQVLPKETLVQKHGMLAGMV
jgi:hypothetical protein